MAFTKRLKIILQSSIFYYVLISLVLLYIFIFTILIKRNSVYQEGEYEISGRVLKYSVINDKLSLEIKAKEKIKATYYIEDYQDISNLKIGSTVTLTGELTTPLSNTIPNTFNYKRYLYNNKIYKIMKVSDLKINTQNISLAYKIKNFIYEKSSINKYIKMFVVGDKSLLEDNIYDSFKNNGVAHLLAVSGMHVSVLIIILNKLLFWLKDKNRKIIISFFLFFYAYIVNFSASILRVVVFFELNSINKIWRINLSSKQLLLLTASVLLLFNPFFIYDVGFLYSFVTVFGLIITQKYLKKNYFYNLLVISFWALLFTLPITVSLNYEINLTTFICNLFLVPFVTFLLYPFALVCFVCPFLLSIFIYISEIMELFISFIDKIDLFVISIPKLNILIIGLYYLLLIMLVHFNYKRYWCFLFSFFVFIKIIPSLDFSYSIVFLDVGQGDSALIVSPGQKKVLLIDTGGILSYGGQKKYYVTNNVILYLKSLGINNIDNVILTHGDYDHMGEAIDLVENFKVEKVIFNCGEFNELEQELIKVLDKKQIPYYSCIKELNIDDNKLYFLNNVDYGNENDNSSVIYTKLNNHKFLFMGDAGIEAEEDLIEKYNLQDIDVLKVGHHGSKTSSGEKFITEINPKYSIISVGKNNRYGHPNDSVLDNLKYSQIYRTDQDGSIMFKINKDKLKIETCTP